MTDTVDKRTRSYIMSCIRSHDTKPEIHLRKTLHRAGFRYRLKTKVENIQPDIVLTSIKTCIFMDGCFWHGCPKCYKPPRSNKKFWKQKIVMNQTRDIKQTKMLAKKGWRVVRIWEHDVMSDNMGWLLKRLKR